MRLLLVLVLGLDGKEGSPLFGNPLGAALAEGLVAQTTGLHLVGKVLRPPLLGLGVVTVLHKNTLVLEHVTLRLQVELVVAEMLEQFIKRTDACRSFQPHGTSGADDAAHAGDASTGP